MFYRYAERYPAMLPDGAFPTMTLAPYSTDNQLRATGTLYRGVEDRSFQRARGWGETGHYYPAQLLSDKTRGHFDFGDVFSVILTSTGIASTFTIASHEAIDSACDFAAVHGGFLRDFPWGDSWPDHQGDGGDPGFEPGRFFGGTTGGDSWVRTPEEVAGKVSRSGNFKAGAAPVLFTRYLGRTSNAVSWLNTFPYDTVLFSLPDIFVLTELVRTSTGTVLWADTQSVRNMSTDVESTLLSVPVDVYATFGESVYIRLRPVPTMDIAYQLSGG